jgi:hypothetical protein
MHLEDEKQLEDAIALFEGRSNCKNNTNPVKICWVFASTAHLGQAP